MSKYTYGWLGLVVGIVGIIILIIKYNYEFKNRTSGGC
ncbi:hypothetical protein CLV90_2038 [Maribacter spongiicola]|uniref:Uncharacterized protein n=1 Tax=Maribacter spongiicola TaxID=1206753 RepID=A0A4R7K5K3_9FLAO|nr:hypothetical protein CLV90_2038 [Maribacter spongiicola]